jgi:hypothetical protein
MSKRAILLLGVQLILLLYQAFSLAAQNGPTATPAPISIATAAPVQVTLGATWTAQPTLAPQVVLEALDVANVRAQPDTNATQLGSIRSGEVYPVLGRYFEWYQFSFDPSPSGYGWVFGQLVNIIGDPALIPDIDLAAQPTLDVNAANATSTQEVLTLTPGGLLTATAFARFMEIDPNGTPGAAGALPTFTYPPGAPPGPPTPRMVLSEQEASAPSTTESSASGLPPLLPILGLAGLGVLGLLISALRR